MDRKYSVYLPAGYDSSDRAYPVGSAKREAELLPGHQWADRQLFSIHYISPHEFRIQNGAHDWAYWRIVLPEFMTYISDSFRK